MSGLTALAPAMKPASNFSIRPPTPLTPPMNPSLPVVDLSAAAAPTRNEPCSSENTRPAMLSPYGRPRGSVVKSSIAESMTPKLLVGVRLANRGGVSFEQESDRDHDVVAICREVEQFLAVRSVVVGRCLSERDAELVGGSLEPVCCGVVERLVATTADVEHQADLRGVARWCCGGAVRSGGAIRCGGAVRRGRRVGCSGVARCGRHAGCVCRCCIRVVAATCCGHEA